MRIWNFLIVASCIAFFVVLLSLGKSATNYFLLLGGELLIWLGGWGTVQTTTDLVKQFGAKTWWEVYWTVEGISGIKNLLGLFVLGLVMLVLSFLL